MTGASTTFGDEPKNLIINLIFYIINLEFNIYEFSVYNDLARIMNGMQKKWRNYSWEVRQGRETLIFSTKKFV